MSSRDVTEDLITIAFAPTDKILDAAEKRRVVDKFLGSPAGSAVDNQYDALRRQNSIASSSAASTTANVPVNASVKTGGVVSQNIALLAAASAGRPATPPMTPAVGDGGSFSAGSTTVAANRAYISTMQASATTDGVHARTMSQQSAQSTGTAGGENKSAMDMTSALERLNQAASKLMTEDAENTSATANQPATSIDSSTTARASSPQQKAEADLVTAVHDFTARSDRELSFKKNDVLVVKQRQESWLYATHHNQPGSKSGWIPVSYTAAKK